MTQANEAPYLSINTSVSYHEATQAAHNLADNLINLANIIVDLDLRLKVVEQRFGIYQQPPEEPAATFKGTIVLGEGYRNFEDRWVTIDGFCEINSVGLLLIPDYVPIVEEICSRLMVENEFGRNVITGVLLENGTLLKKVYPQWLVAKAFELAGYRLIRKEER